MTVLLQWRFIEERCAPVIGCKQTRSSCVTPKESLGKRPWIRHVPSTPSAPEFPARLRGRGPPPEFREGGRRDRRHGERRGPAGEIARSLARSSSLRAPTEPRRGADAAGRAL